jgi:GNAT superfamily N-acetyltransferase
LHVLRGLQDIVGVRADVELLGAHTGKSVADLLSRGTSVYFLTDAERLVCQLLVTPGDRVRVDTPSGLVLSIGSACAFVSYVYTHEAYRRTGAARRLLAEAEADLARLGITHVFAHVSATNVPSLQTFRKAGWRQSGVMVFSRKGRMLFSHQRGKPRIGVASDE